jgi:probable biosynthetic protein (TIGR04099 family)
MNSPIPPRELQHLLSRAIAASSMPDVVVLGMPHLCTIGLSETWLLKECGHRHWFMLAEAAGLSTPDFRDQSGDPIYAAFVSVSVRNAASDSVREHDKLIFASRLERTSRTQFTSVHRFAVAGREIGEIAMTSTFVRRTQKGINRTIARTDVPALRRVQLRPEPLADTAEAAALRSNRWHTHLGFERRKATVIDRLIVELCPGQDFNGAGFLYFANFQAFVDRAEWAYFPRKAPFPTTRRRDIVYRGNVDPGERVVLSLLQFRRTDEGFAHWYHLEREQDGTVIADVFTVRGLPTAK